MGGTDRFHIVVSAVNIRKGGTLTVLNECLSYLSRREDLSVTALVHDSRLALYPSINYIEIPWSVRSWFHRLWCEYVYMHRLSRRLQPVRLWLSLHDTTPRVIAEKQAVYCHTSFPFMHIRMRDFVMDIKIPLFAMFTRYAYKINAGKNNYLIVQQNWFRSALSEKISFPPEKIIVAPPRFTGLDILDKESVVPTFFYPSTADSHKNFELVCEAAEMLEKKLGKGYFRVVLTLDGLENIYASWIYDKWNKVTSISFRGFMSREKLIETYSNASCLVFVSRSESWGLPISEFKHSGKAMILADLPYAHETAAGAGKVAFVSPDDANELCAAMSDFISGDMSSFSAAPPLTPGEPYAGSWDELFGKLI